MFAYYRVMGKAGIRLDKQTASLLAHPLRGAMWQTPNTALAPAVTAASDVIRAAEVIRFRHLAQMVERDHVNGGSIKRTALWLARHSNLLLAEARGLVQLSIRISADPNVLRAYANGAIGARAAKIILEFLYHPPANMPQKGQDAARTRLLKKARRLTLDQLRDEVNRIRDLFDDTIPAGEDLERNSLFDSTSWQKRTYLSGDFDAETGAMLRSALSPLEAPRPEPDGAPDKRAPSKRRADAFREVLRRYHQFNDGGRSEGGAKPGLSVIVPVDGLIRGELAPAKKLQLISQERYDELFDESAQAWSVWMGSMSMEAARRLACDCELTVIGVDPNGAPLSADTQTRVAIGKLRLALIARDKRCAFPHCDRPVAWTEGHHIRHWANGGATEIGNLVLLCNEHHHSVHHDGWEVIIGPDRMPAFRPPAYFDPLRRWLDPDGRKKPPGYGGSPTPISVAA